MTLTAIGRLSDSEYLRALSRPEAKLAMELRCAETGHDWQNCCSVTLHIYQECKWCGERRGSR